MEHDTNRTLGEINGSKEVLLQKVEGILSMAVVNASDDEPLQLRFLTPLMGRKYWANNEDCQDFRLTVPNEHRQGREYITVSYLWKHTQPTTGLPTLPNFRVWDGALTPVTPRPVRCSKVVFERVMRFARRMNCLYIWIDQECIDQNDSRDVEKHLNIMHRVYSESRWTVAVLSKSLFRREHVTDIIDITKNTHVAGSTKRQREKVAVLAYVSRDKWFARTWAFQERQCARSLHLLIPAGRSMDDLSKDDHASFSVGRDLCIDMAHLRSWINSIPSNLLQVDPKLSPTLVRGILKCFNQNSTPCLADSSFDGSTILHKQFANMEKCENLILADRLSILGNICHLSYRLCSNRLNDASYSYSNCVLALAMVNLYPSRTQRAVAFTSTIYEPLLQLRIVAALKYMTKM